MENYNDLISTELVIDSSCAANLKETAMWSRFLGIFGFIYSGIISVLAIFIGFFFENTSSRYVNNSMALAGSLFIGVIYFVMAVIVFFISIYLYRFGTKTQVALKTNDQETLIESFKNLRFYFRFVGVIAIISIVFIFLGIIVVLIGVSASH